MSAIPGVITSILLETLSTLSAPLKLLVAASLGLVLWLVLRARRRRAVPSPHPPGDVGSGTRRWIWVLVVLALLGVASLVLAAALWSRPTWGAVALAAVVLAGLVAAAVAQNVSPTGGHTLVAPAAAALAGATLGLGAGISVTEATASPPAPPPDLVGAQVTTFDGLTYELRAVGDLIQARSRDGEIEMQVRLEPVRVGTALLPLATAAAVRAGDDVVLFTVEPPVARLDGRVLPPDSPTRTAEGLLVEWSGSGWTVRAPTGEVASVTVRPEGYLGTSLAPGDDERVWEGLLGDGDGDASNDLRVRDGQVLDPPTVADGVSQERVDGVYADSWRVPAREDLLG